MKHEGTIRIKINFVLIKTIKYNYYPVSLQRKIILSSLPGVVH